MSTIQKIEKEIIEDFAMFEDWIQKYEYLIDLGKELAPIQAQYKTEDNLIKGCQSKVWLHAEHTKGKIIYTADSDAIMTKGIVAILIIGLKEQLSATRANGLLSMIKKMKLYALAFNK